MTGGLLVVDKPTGPTSHDIVDRVRRLLSVRRVGHTGTLDPFATGVLPLLVGKATRLARFIGGGEKHYAARVRFGFATTTDDGTGEALQAETPTVLEKDALEAACATLVGTILQIPPAYSAKRVGGQHLYDLARRGAPVPRTGSEVTVHAIDIVRVEGAEADLEVRCSTGTYVRAIARDLGTHLGCGAHLVALRRTRSGAFTLEEAVALENMGQDPWTHVRPLNALLTDLPAVLVGAEGKEAILKGRDLTRGLVLSGFPEEAPERLRMLDEGGDLLGLAVPRGFEPLGMPHEPLLHPEIVLA